MNHVWGLFSHPDREMQVIKSENETVSHHYTHHVLLMAAIPVVCAFIGTTQIGWNFGDGNVLQLAVYRFCAGGLVLRRDAGGRRGDGTRHLVDGAKLSATAIACALYGFAGYVATPLFLSGLVALYPWYGYAHWSALSRFLHRLFAVFGYSDFP